ncbi:MAG: hypothetical protein ABI351_13910 [Herbaspirillum sp.]
MSRQQFLVCLPDVVITSHLVSHQLYSSTKLVKSVLIMAPLTNVDFVYIGDSLTQNIPLAPGKSCELTGDNYDVGASARYDLSIIYIRALSDGDKVSVSIGDGL